MTKIGTGFVEIQADFGPFWRDVARQMGGSELDRLGRDSGQSFAQSFRKGTDSAGLLSGFNDDLDRSRSRAKQVGDAAGKDFARGITQGIDPARAKLNVFARDGAASFKSVGTSARKASEDLKRTYADISKQNISRAMRDIERDSARGSGAVRKLSQSFSGMFSSMGGGGGGGGFKGLSRDVSGFGAAAGGATATIGGFRIALAALVPITLGFGGALVSVVSALGPLVGLAAAAGNALGAAAQGMGVFALATMGVADALKEQIDKTGKAASAAISNAGQQRAAARAIEGAQDAVRTASQRLGDALRDERLAVAALGPAYTAARMRLNDLKEAVTDANLSLRGAKLAAQDARKALSDLLSGPSPRALADAHQAVEDAVKGERDAFLDLIDAQKAYTDLFKPADALDVADATDAVTDALRNEERARLDLNDQAAKTAAILADPTSTADQQARARLDLADAENSVGDATRETTRAKERLAQLEAPPDQAAIEAARRKVGDAEDSVAAAARGTAKAREDLATVEAPAQAAEIAAARYNVAVAENALGDAERDRIRAVRALTEAEAKGIERSDEVVVAREALRQASRGVAAAEHDQTRALQSLSDAQASAKESTAGMALASQNLNEKLDKLPPAAQAFVKELVAMKPRLDQIRQTAAQGFFPGATEGLHAAMGSFSEINHVVGETATVLGEAARKSGELVGSPAFGRDIQTIGHNNAKVIDTLGEAMRHVVSAIRHVMVAAGPLTQWLADVINKWALNAAAAAKSGRETGKLADFFEKTRAVAERLGSILGHLASGLLGLGKAGSDSGNDILRSIDRAAKRFDKWANSDEGQKKLKDFFQSAKELAAALTKAISGAAGAVAYLSLKVLPLTAAMKLLGPYIDDAVTAFVAFKAATWGYAAAAAAASFATGGWVTAFWALNAAMYANPIGAVVVAVAALAAGLIYAYHHSETFRNTVNAVWGALKDAFGWLKDNWPLVLGILTGPIGTAVYLIAKHIDDIIGFFKALPGHIADAIKAGVNFLVDAGSWVVNRVSDGVKAVAGFAADVGGWIKNRVSDGIHALVDAFKAVGGWILNRITEGFKTVTDLFGTVGGWLKNRFEEFIHNEIEGLKTIGSWVLNRLVDGFKTVTDALGSIGGWLKNRITDLVNGAKDGFLSVGGSILDFIVDGMKSGLNKLIDLVNEIIGVINKIPGVDIGTIKHVKMAQGGVNAMARGGAFARTGGVVDSPIVLMGEEAPAHPEFVIPTNPQYRDRAQQLLMQAWGRIGFAQGGVYSKNDLASLWKRANPGVGDPNLMAAIALAESGGNPKAHNPSGASGLWQILGLPFPGDPYDPVTNAKMAGAKLQSQGLGAWEAYTNGAYKQFAGSSRGGLLSKITGAVGDLLSKGADFILGKLPDLGGLPDWLKGTGHYILEKVGDWIKDTVSNVIGLGGGDGAPAGGVSKAIQGAMALARKMGLAITSTTGGEHVANSYHYLGRAADVAGSPAQMAAFFSAALGHYDGSLKELFYDPSGAIKNGVRIPAIGGHSDHVHIALAQGGILGADGDAPFGGSFASGGIVPGPIGQPRLIEAHAGEMVLPNGMQLHADIYIGGQRIDERVDVRLAMRDRQSATAWRAGKT